MYSTYIRVCTICRHCHLQVLKSRLIARLLIGNYFNLVQCCHSYGWMDASRFCYCCAVVQCPQFGTLCALVMLFSVFALHNYFCSKLICSSLMFNPLSSQCHPELFISHTCRIKLDPGNFWSDTFNT